MQPITMMYVCKYIDIYNRVWMALPASWFSCYYISTSMNSIFSKPSMMEAWINEAYFLIVSKETPTLQVIKGQDTHICHFLPEYRHASIFHCSSIIMPPRITKKFRNYICSFSKEIWKWNKRMELHVWVSRLRSHINKI